MQTINLLWGLMSMTGVFIAFFPCLGALNWFVIPFAGIGLMLSLATFMFSKRKNKVGSVLGIGLCGIAVGVGMLRLGLGFGIL
ncbi:MAG TPA: LPXTG cell wall anchor domain-containing protein [Thermodesulfovibrionia bacterium]|nr:LPXTG cell wall anchor domain-containing protein [Thermodesulfovibrionia bacterium]